MKQPTPIYQITLNGKDLTSKISPRLNHLSLDESRSDEADTLMLSLDDADGKLVLPKRGEVVRVAFGWSDTGLVDKGSFTINEIEHAGTPDMLTIQARSASMTKGLGERKEKSWHGETIGAIVRKIAGAHGLKPAITEALAEIVIAHIDQTHESDMSFLTRLAKRYDAVMNVKDTHLLFVPIGHGTSVSGKALAPVELTRKEGDRHRYHVSERENYACVRAFYHATGRAKRKSIVVGGEDNHNAKVLPETYATEADARAAATAELNRTKRSQATMTYNLALGRPDLYPEVPVYLNGFKPDIDAESWLVKKVRHEIDGNGGYTCELELETRDDPTSERHRTHFRKGGQ
ncbi:phage late control D family protein [Paraburkholderia phenoliruptrix]|uniref:phage late control D family protein n=1 Tax=Paraburkholderia phenoliruptrix TaxID=252970 RepID=UPI00286556B0|nr:phage late control D family protein [Paraburkholderia phenoliruptrix]MDR6387586.1 phage protein D [Paraburkholderia phenoliruptrix]